eukprot:scaffold561_cov162-Amphora_coffeaeformis.AAC.4
MMNYNRKWLRHISSPFYHPGREVIMAVKQEGYALLCAPSDLKGDFDLVAAAVENQGLALQFATHDLPKNFNIVL